jgi:hypothetical protein
MHFHGSFPWKPHEYDQEQLNGKVRIYPSPFLVLRQLVSDTHRLCTDEILIIETGL